MKAEIRVVGFDDGPFAWEDERAPVVGAVTRGAGYLESLLATDVAVDGDDATTRLAEAVERSPHRPELKAILLDGCSLGGFNVVDLRALAARVGLPVLTVTKGEPDWDGIREALRKHHSDWERRWALLADERPEAMPTASGLDLFVRAVGASRAEAAEILARTTVRGNVPEALRVAHMVASLLRRPRA